jgi:peptidoglycan/LPS O-acetylase OafA/YrhL
VTASALRMGTDWEATERRLVERSAERRTALDRRDRRRRWLPWVFAPVILPVAGAAVLLAVMEREGGDFGGWATGEAIAVIAASFAVPALLAGWIARRRGVVEAVAWALVCVGVQVALVVGVGFLILELGPD